MVGRTYSDRVTVLPKQKAKNIMSHALPRSGRNILHTTSALIGVIGLLLATPAIAAFDPGSDVSTPGTIAAPAPGRHLPDTSILSGAQPVTRPLYGTGTAPASTGYVSPLQPIAMPRPLYEGTVASPASSNAAAPTPLYSNAPSLPPVDPAVAARAEKIMATQAPAPARVLPAPSLASAPVAPSQGFVPPAPLMAKPTELAPAPALASAPVEVPAAPPVAAVAAPRIVPAAPAPAATSVAVAAAVPAAPAPQLSEESRSVLSSIPSNIDTPKATPGTAKLSLARVSPQIQEVLGKEAQEEAYNSVGLSIKVRRPGLDTNYELNNAYTALMGGDTTQAIEIYKNILGQEPRNEDALFGLAATYHRIGQQAQAKPYYAMLLKIDPNHREALNNFLSLVSEESPADALPELERLELRNPDFSPIPAQIAIVQDKLGYPDRAEDKMLRAIELAPDNLTYKYNLAIMLDRHKRYADAGALYKLLIDAAMNGQPVPASIDSMQRRLTYITTAANEGRAGG